jgi:hypothetical protein
MQKSHMTAEQVNNKIAEGENSQRWTWRSQLISHFLQYYLRYYFLSFHSSHRVNEENHSHLLFLSSILSRILLPFSSSLSVTPSFSFMDLEADLPSLQKEQQLFSLFLGFLLQISSESFLLSLLQQPQQQSPHHNLRSVNSSSFLSLTLEILTVLLPSCLKQQKKRRNCLQAVGMILLQSISSFISSSFSTAASSRSASSFSSRASMISFFSMIGREIRWKYYYSTYLPSLDKYFLPSVATLVLSNEAATASENQSDNKKMSTVALFVGSYWNLLSSSSSVLITVPSSEILRRNDLFFSFVQQYYEEGSTTMRKGEEIERSLEERRLFLAFALHSYVTKATTEERRKSSETDGVDSRLLSGLASLHEVLPLEILYERILLSSSSSSGGKKGESMFALSRQFPSQLSSIIMEKFLSLRILGAYLTSLTSSATASLSSAESTSPNVALSPLLALSSSSSSNDKKAISESEAWLTTIPIVLKEELFSLFQFSSILTVASSSASTSSGEDLSVQFSDYELRIQFSLTWITLLLTIEHLSSLSSLQSNNSGSNSSSKEGDDSIDIKNSFALFCESSKWFEIAMNLFYSWSSDVLLFSSSSSSASSVSQRKKYDLQYLQSLSLDQLVFSHLTEFEGRATGSNSGLLEEVSLEYLTTLALYKTIFILPSMFRHYWTHCCSRNEKDILLRFVEEHVRTAMIKNEIEKIKEFQPTTATDNNNNKAGTDEPESGKTSFFAKKEEGEGDIDGATIAVEEGGMSEKEKFQIFGNLSKGEINAILLHDESKIELSIIIPSEFPLKNVEITCNRLIGIQESKWLKWKLMMLSLMNSQDKSIIEAVLWWKMNITRELEGIGKKTTLFSSVLIALLLFFVSFPFFPFFP